MFEGLKPFRNVEERRQRAIYLHFRSATDRLPSLQTTRKYHLPFLSVDQLENEEETQD